MLFIAHQQGHTVDADAGGGASTPTAWRTLMGVGYSILLGVLTWT